jgi:hypothetical protein
MLMMRMKTLPAKKNPSMWVHQPKAIANLINQKLVKNQSHVAIDVPTSTQVGIETGFQKIRQHICTVATEDHH